jgi:hypothetical protein
MCVYIKLSLDRVVNEMHAVTDSTLRNQWFERLKQRTNRESGVVPDAMCRAEHREHLQGKDQQSKPRRERNQENGASQAEQTKELRTTQTGKRIS